MSFNREYTVRAVRKRCQCDACRKYIELGESAVRWTGMHDGDFHSCAYHSECREAEIAYNRMAGSGYDDWWPLNEMEADDHAWLIADFPIVAERFGLATPPPPLDAGK